MSSHRTDTLSHPQPNGYRIALVVCLTSGLLASCAGKKDPDPIPPQTTTRVTPQLEPPPELPAPVRQVRPTRASTVKVIDPGGEVDDERPKTLLEASELAKKRQREGTAEPPALVINDENLHEYAEKAEIIMVEGEPAAPPITTTRVVTPTGTDPLLERGEQYWRSRALEIRMGWRRTLDRIEELELESAALRQEFYAEEDPYLRDSQVKPAWDRVLDRLEQHRLRASQYEQELEAFLNEGHRAGAEPGWLAEGWELEPETKEAKEPEEMSIHRPTDIPVAVDEVEDP